MTSKTNQLKPYVVVEPITASDATVVGSLSEAPETIPGPSTFNQDLDCLLPFKMRILKGIQPIVHHSEIRPEPGKHASRPTPMSLSKAEGQ